MTVTAASHQSTAATILIIDDDPNLRLLLSSALMELGYHVITAQDGHEGVTQTTTEHPDIVLVDAVMPELDGISYCRAIQDYYVQAGNQPSKTSETGKTTTSPGPAILMLTAMADNDTIVRAFAAGASDFITKPIQLPILQQRLKHCIEKRQLHQRMTIAEAEIRQLRVKLAPVT